MNSSKRNLLIGYGVSLLLLIICALASWLSIRNLLNSSDWVNHTNEVIKRLDAIVMDMREAEAGQRGYLLTNDERFLASYTGAYDKAISKYQQVRSLTSDNAQQQADMPKLEELIKNRFTILQRLIDIKSKTAAVSPETLEEGRDAMEQLGGLIKVMEDREQKLLEVRTADLNRLASYTPAVILIASLLAILVTIYSFYKVNGDFKKRTRLQQSLEEKNSEISDRIRIIESLSTKIASGNFTTRVDENDRQNLGVLAESLDKMAASLQYSFANLSDKEWQQTGLAELNEIMIGEKNLKSLTYNTLAYLTAYTKSHTGAFYLAHDDKSLAFIAGIALDQSRLKKHLAFGEGIAGQSARSEKEIYLQNILETEMAIDFSNGALLPKSIIAIPVFYEKKLKGVIELGSRNDFTKVAHEFLKTASFNIGLAIHSARDHERLAELLGETQAQSEELQSQHSELENVNAELEAQAEKLQASEEELKVQQEELQQANSELEERSRLLEEKNELILERNLDIQGKAEQLELSTKYKSEFLANMSHELRTPLNSILLLSRLLSENHQLNLNVDQVEYAQVIQNSGKSLLTLIDEILDLSKIESGKMEPEYADVKIEEISAELKSLFGPMAKEKNIEFGIDVHKDVPTVMETDRLRAEQILRNLLSNALKFTKQGSVKLIISKEKEQLAFTVKDTGIGIPKEKQQTIFEAFQQADGSTRRQYGGTGLGLSISRELAKLLGGSIRLKSEEGAGSEFALLLPIAPVKESEITGGEQPENTGSHEESSPVHKPENKYLSDTIPPAVPDDRDNISKKDKCILIIEDDTGFARSLLDYTRNRGYKAIVAVRGDEALALAKQFLPQGILLDVQLPVKSGWDVMDELKADPATRAIPVHMMSSHEVKMKSLSKGAVDFINKPVAFEKLGEMIRKIEDALSRYPKKVLIVEENAKHAQALAYFLQSFNVTAEIKESVGAGIEALNGSGADCVILDMGIPAQQSYDTLDAVKKTPGLENLPIIVFTGKNLSLTEESRIRQYADSIVIKTAHSYQRILDEVSLFLHLVEENKKDSKAGSYRKAGNLAEVLKGKTILVADDDVRNIFSLTKSLETYGVNVISAIDGKEAVKQLDENPKIDLVLMDMMMPEMDGYESTKRIRQNPKYRNLPIIAVTAKAMTGDREKCINAGASDYITKPVDVDQLISLLRVWLYA